MAAPSLDTWSTRTTWVVPPLHPFLGPATATSRTAVVTMGTGVQAQSMRRGLLVNHVPVLAPSCVLEAFAACLDLLVDSRNAWVLTNVDYASLVSPQMVGMLVLSYNEAPCLQAPMRCEVDLTHGTLALCIDNTVHARATVANAPLYTPTHALLFLNPAPPCAVSDPVHAGHVLCHAADAEATQQLAAYLAPPGAPLPLVRAAQAVHVERGVPTWCPPTSSGVLLRGVAMGMQPAAPVATVVAQPAATARPSLDSDDTLEAVVAQMVTELVGSPVPLDAPLLAAGLDSLAAVELPGQLSARYGIPLDATLVIDHPTIHAIAEHLKARTRVAPTPRALAPVTPAVKGRPVAILRSAGDTIFQLGVDLPCTPRHRPHDAI